jgi:hypothetical protein
MPTLCELKDVATIVGVLVAAVSLAIGAYNTRLAVRTNRAKFWLDLRSAFARHDEVHCKFRPGGRWSDNSGPSTVEEYCQVEAYMGLFEHCEIMLDQTLIDERTFTEIYRYRLFNLVGNDWVRVEKLCKHPDGWKRMLALLRRLDVDFKCNPSGDPVDHRQR